LIKIALTHREVNGKILKVPRKYFVSREEFKEFIDSEKEWMYNRIFEAIEYAFKKGHIEARILEAKIEESMTQIEMNSPMDEWEKSLNLALEWNIKQENYEVCSKIHKLIQEVKDFLKTY